MLRVRVALERLGLVVADEPPLQRRHVRRERRLDPLRLARLPRVLVALPEDLVRVAALGEDGDLLRLALLEHLAAPLGAEGGARAHLARRRLRRSLQLEHRLRARVELLEPPLLHLVLRAALGDHALAQLAHGLGVAGARGGELLVGDVHARRVLRVRARHRRVRLRHDPLRRARSRAARRVRPPLRLDIDVVGVLGGLVGAARVGELEGEAVALRLRRARRRERRVRPLRLRRLRRAGLGEEELALADLGLDGLHLAARRRAMSSDSRCAVFWRRASSRFMSASSCRDATSAACVAAAAAA